MTYSIPFHNVYGENKLFIDYINKETAFFPHSYKDLASFRKKLHEVAARSYDYYFLHKIALKQNEELQKNNSCWNDIMRILKKGNYCCVVTGQQPGLLGGPLYTLYKALTAIKLAQWVQDKLHYPCIPVFWMVSEDHDIAEIASVTLLDNEWELHSVKEEVPLIHQKQMLSTLSCNSTYISSIISYAKSFLPSTIYKEDVLNSFYRFYESPTNIVHAFANLFSGILKNLPILLLDPSDEEIKKAAAPLFFRLTDEYENVYSQLDQNTSALISQGYQAQVKINPGQLPFFFIHENKRFPLFLEQDIHLKETNQVFPKNHFLKLIHDSAQKISPNVLSRPLMQDYILPTIAYVGGAAEISYLAQISSLYRYLAIPLPVIFPRHSATLIFRKAQKILHKLGITADAYVINSMITDNLVKDEDITHLFQKTRNSINVEMDTLIAEVVKKDSALKESGEETKEKILHYLSKYEKKNQHFLAKKNENLMQNIKILGALLKPFGKLQERELSLINLVALEGQTSIATIYNNIDLFNFAHHVYEI